MALFQLGRSNTLQDIGSSEYDDTAYDSLGNLKEGMTSFQRMMFEIQTDIDIPLAAPFAAVTLLNQYGIDWSVFRNQIQHSKDRK
ncbi:hypothetical protein [Cupriavidus sp. MP-37]|uniref:hypothetical protein n=1 Tax=Cupriavidus sp. MP-37 TaxID=2884455 RepID=UPI001D0B30FD|nr:hypothetical protein [Cupriavidus sp. MP-37]UDM50232.1 hypothetical protein LIN44_00100 [Cupriavidus sp. MP-37]